MNNRYLGPHQSNLGFPLAVFTLFSLYSFSMLPLMQVVRPNQWSAAFVYVCVGGIGAAIASLSIWAAAYGQAADTDRFWVGLGLTLVGVIVVSLFSTLPSAFAILRWTSRRYGLWVLAAYAVAVVAIIMSVRAALSRRVPRQEEVVLISSLVTGYLALLATALLAVRHLGLRMARLPRLNLASPLLPSQVPSLVRPIE